jgi:uncharacterized protein YbcV (DUF1398 family)
MSKAIENLETAFQRAMEIRPKVGGFPYLAETLRMAFPSLAFSLLDWRRIIRPARTPRR